MIGPILPQKLVCETKAPVHQHLVTSTNVPIDAEEERPVMLKVYTFPH